MSADLQIGLMKLLAMRHFPAKPPRPKLGTGRVAALLTAQRDARARIRFQGAGSKTLVLKHAPLAVIE